MPPVFPRFCNLGLLWPWLLVHLRFDSGLKSCLPQSTVPDQSTVPEVRPITGLEALLGDSEAIEKDKLESEGTQSEGGIEDHVEGMGKDDRGD